MIKKVKYLFIVFLIVFFIKSYSYGMSVNLSNTSVSLKPGGSTTVTVSASDATGNISVSSSNSAVATASINTNWLENNSAQVTIKAISVGTATINVTGKVANNAGTSQTNVSKTINVSVINSSSSSSTLTTQKITTTNSSTSSGKSVKMIVTSPVDFSGFKASNNGPYKVTVESNVSQLNITVKYTDGTAKTYTRNLQEGSNSISVEGYTIIATRKVSENAGDNMVPNVGDEQNQDENTENEKSVDKLRLNNLVLDDELNVRLDPNFDPEVFEYKVILGNDYLDLNELLISAIPNLENAKVTIEGNTNLTDGENLVTITVEAEGYDSQTYTLRVIRGEVQEEIEPVNSDNIVEDNSMKIKIIIAIAATLLILILIILIIILKKRKKNKLRRGKNKDKKQNDDNFDEEEDSDEEEDFGNEDCFEDIDEEEIEDKKENENDILDENEIEDEEIDDIEENIDNKINNDIEEKKRKRKYSRIYL